MNQKVLYIAHAAIIAALYVVLTEASAVLGLASSAIQIRFSEALTILPVFTPAAIPGLFVGCILANLLTGCVPLDVLFGSIATLLGAFGTYYLTHLKKTDNTSFPVLTPWQRRLAPLPPIMANTLIVPFVLAYVYQIEGTIPYFMLTVGIGEVISCGILGLLLFQVLSHYRRHLFPINI
ncbi:MAG: QueT transporter family protein [Acetatifactor sp.]|nr:QueT transporter family protein [Acetatifactor sp.]